jgi:hypothetical protein
MEAVLDWQGWDYKSLMQVRQGRMFQRCAQLCPKACTANSSATYLFAAALGSTIFHRLRSWEPRLRALWGHVVVNAVLLLLAAADCCLLLLYDLPSSCEKQKVEETSFNDPLNSKTGTF